MSIGDWFGLRLPRSKAEFGIAPPATLRDTATGLQPAARPAFDAGLAAHARRDFATAIDCFNQVLKQQHDNAEAHNNLGLSYLEAGRIEEAADAFVLGIHFRPDFASAHYNLALAALKSGDFNEGVRCLERAIKLNPVYSAAHNALGYVLTQKTGDFARGAAHIRDALTLTPADPDVLCNYSAVLAQEGHAEQALRVCDALLAREPHMHEARLNRALALLKLGRFAEGWPSYEARKLAGGNYAARALHFPEWQGEPLQDKALLIYAEQGIGDQIMFASCVPDVISVARSCMLECAPPLTALFTRSFGAVSVVAHSTDDAIMRLAQASDINYQVAIGSLPARFRNRRGDFATSGAYLRADPARSAYWKKRLDELGPGLKVGISWSGGAPSTGGVSRSIRLAQWAPILQNARCHFVNLQHGDARHELLSASPGQPIALHDWPEAIEDFDETAALVTGLDLAITVQTALVHLAGALGKPAWVMLQAGCEWRYGERGNSMPWYPHISLVRQTEAGDWHSVITHIAHKLSELASP